MQIKRQNPSEITARPPQDTVPRKYGEIVATKDGQLFCRDSKGNYKSIASTAKTVNGYTVNTNVPNNAVFYDTSYSFEEGNTKGAFQVNQSTSGASNTAANSSVVYIHGLGSAAYANSSDFATKNDLKRVDAVSLGGSSLQDILTYISNNYQRKSIFGG